MCWALSELIPEVYQIRTNEISFRWKIQSWLSQQYWSWWGRKYEWHLLCSVITYKRSSLTSWLNSLSQISITQFSHSTPFLNSLTLKTKRLRKNLRTCSDGLLLNKWMCSVIKGVPFILQFLFPAQQYQDITHCRALHHVCGR